MLTLPNNPLRYLAVIIFTLSMISVSQAQYDRAQDGSILNVDADSPVVTPIETMSLFIDSFNSADVTALNEITASPFSLLIGEDRYVSDKYGDFLDFQALQNNGWSYSKINSLELIYEDSETSMVHMNFSRYGADDQVILNASANYLLMNYDNNWKIKGYSTKISKADLLQQK
tara:strand:+ start:1853 stop:2371 length:519 start_codon:yes stop_codon:yes gene_type:complete